MKKFTIETVKVITRVFAMTTYPRQAGGKAGDQTRVCIYANDSAEMAEAVIREAKKSKVVKNTFRCMGEEMTLTRYTDSHFTCRKNGKTTKLSSSLYYKLLKSLKDSAEWYEI